MAIEILTGKIEDAGHGLHDKVLKFVGEQGHTPQFLMEHVAQVHTLPGIAAGMKIARYDLEKLAKYEIPSGDLIGLLLEIIKRGASRLQYDGYVPTLLENNGRRYIEDIVVKNIKYAELLGLAKVDWVSVERLIPGAKKTKVYLPRDSSDSFFEEQKELGWKIKKYLSMIFPFSRFMETKRVALKDFYP